MLSSNILTKASEFTQVLKLFYVSVKLTSYVIIHNVIIYRLELNYQIKVNKNSTVEAI